MPATLQSLCEFFEREVPRLSATYSWKIPSIRGFDGVGESGYAANIRLKDYLSEQWRTSSRAEKLGWARVIVSDWGGVRRNKDTTLEEYVRRLDAPEPETPLKGVSSYSKVFAIARPELYAIYDSRVAACINAVQVNAGVTAGTAFLYVPGRNNIVGNRKKRTGFTEQPEYSVRHLVDVGWRTMRRDDTYVAYVALLRDCGARLERYESRQLEMALFANAEVECVAALDALKSSPR